MARHRRLLAALLCGAGVMPVAAQDGGLNLYGRPGSMDTPTAQVMPDGELAVTLGALDGQRRNTLSFQISPRLTGSFRYSRIDDIFDGDDLFDRSFDLSYQILTETSRRPALSIGLRDFIGTGVLGAEYIVASKSIGRRLDITAGLGWGRLGQEGALGAPFGERPRLDFGEGGTLTEDQWFRGDVAPFGSVSFKATDNLTLLAEYSSDDYGREASRDLFTPSSPINVGARYAFDNGATLGAYYLYGETLAATLSFSLNPRKGVSATGLEPGPVPVLVRPSRAADPEAWEADWITRPSEIASGKAALATALEKEGVTLDAATFTATRAAVTISNPRYGAHPQAIGRTARILSRIMPASIEVFEITLALPSGVPSTTTVVARRDLERLEFAGAEALIPRVTFADAVGRASSEMLESDDRLSWSLAPAIRFSLFDPDSPVRGALDARLRGSYDIGRGLVAEGAVSATIIGDLDEISELTDSALPRVRSDIGLYQGNPRLDTAVLHHYGRPGRNLFSRVTAGYLETMYGGVSGEMLWFPATSAFAFGAEVNQVAKRDYDQGFGFQDYTTTTAHASAYYDFGNGYLGQLDVGRYLAGDVGATLTLSREFANGWSVGAYATRTDVSFEDFGEGSFDKGILLTIPLEWALGTPNRKRTGINLRSLSRDGGARVKVPGTLYGQVRETRGPELEDRWGRFWR